MNGPQSALLADGRRLHFNHGPIDLIIEAFGDPDEVRTARAQAEARFATILTELVAELPELRRPASGRARAFAGTTAQRMEAAAVPFAARFVTPMAAVAGAVAEEMLAAMLEGRRLDRAYVNDGGDIGLFLAPGQEIGAAIAGTGHGFGDRIAIRAADPVRGIATSGWRGRSFSLGIADAVTVLAKTAAVADVAATLIGNAVDLPGHQAIGRQPACELAPDSDLGGQLVTISVGELAADEVAQALENGAAIAEEFCTQGLIEAAALFLNGETRVVATPAMQRSFAPLSVLPDISPTRGEIGRPLFQHPFCNAGDRRKPVSQSISSLVGEMSGRTEGGNVGRKAVQAERQEPFR